MKKLSILRHAKAEAADATTADYQRKLTERGHEDTQCIAKALKRLHLPIEWILSSPATRASETTHGILDALKTEIFINWQEGIYEASPGTLLHLLADIPDGIEHVLLVGHNPGLEELIAGLCNGAASQPTVRLATSTLAHLELEIFSWNQVRWGCGSLHLLIQPKMLHK